MSTIKSLGVYVQHKIDEDVTALNNIRDRLAKAIDRLDGNDTATLIKLGSDISRVIAAIDWRTRELKRRRNTVQNITNEIEQDIGRAISASMVDFGSTPAQITPSENNPISCNPAGK